MNFGQVIFKLSDSKDAIKQQWNSYQRPVFENFMKMRLNQLSISQMQSIFDANEPELTALLRGYMQDYFDNPNPEIKNLYLKNSL